MSLNTWPNRERSSLGSDAQRPRGLEDGLAVLCCSHDFLGSLYQIAPTERLRSAPSSRELIRCPLEPPSSRTRSRFAFSVTAFIRPRRREIPWASGVRSRQCTGTRHTPFREPHQAVQVGRAGAEIEPVKSLRVE